MYRVQAYSMDVKELGRAKWTVWSVVWPSQCRYHACEHCNSALCFGLHTCPGLSAMPQCHFNNITLATSQYAVHLCLLSFCWQFRLYMCLTFLSLGTHTYELL